MMEIWFFGCKPRVPVNITIAYSYYYFIKAD